MKLKKKYKNAGLTNKIECPSGFVKAGKKKQIVKRKKISDLRKEEIKKCENMLKNNLLSFPQRNALEKYLKSIKNE